VIETNLKMTKSEAAAVEQVAETTENKKTYVSPISDPIVGGKLKSRCLKVLKKANSSKNIRRGAPEVTKIVRKGKQGIVVFAADIFPVELIAHIPVLCEEKDVLYCFVNSRAELGEAVSSKRPVSVVFIQKPHADSPYEEAYNQVVEGLREVHPYMGKVAKK
jgi:H/ACA ribonucleoprotein complex subunit 2